MFKGKFGMACFSTLGPTPCYTASKFLLGRKLFLDGLPSCLERVQTFFLFDILNDILILRNQKYCEQGFKNLWCKLKYFFSRYQVYNVDRRHNSITVLIRVQIVLK